MLGTTLAAVAVAVAATTSAAATVLSTGALLALGLTPGGAATPQACSGVTVVVDTSALPVSADAASATPASSGVVACADVVTGDTADGLVVLRDAGVSIEGTAQWGTAFVCRVDGRPGPEEDIVLPGGGILHETCTRTPSTQAYWSLWSASPAAGSAWEYAQAGVADLELAPGSVLGLVFSVGQDAPATPGITASDARAGRTGDGWTARASAQKGSATAEPSDRRAEDSDSPALLAAAVGLVVVMILVSVVLARRRQ